MGQSKLTICRILLGLGTAIVPALSGPAAIGQDVAKGTAAGSATVSTGDATNAANDPTTPKLTINLYNYFMPTLRDRGGRNGNEAVFRVSDPFTAFGVSQIIRMNLPVDTVPSATNQASTGTGDVQIYDILLFKTHGLTLGGGPLLATPTASGTLYGTSRWQAGVDAVIIVPQKWGLLGGLFTYQRSFTGSVGNPVQEIAFQPIVHYNFSSGYYLRSTGVWTCNPSAAVYTIPIGFGGGKVWSRPNGDSINAYLEPQRSIYQASAGSPGWQIFAGITFQFELHKNSSGN